MRVCVRACVRACVCVCVMCAHIGSPQCPVSCVRLMIAPHDSVVFRELGVPAFFLVQRSRCCDPFGNLGCGGGGRHELRLGLNELV